jgi:hypothetical protein
VGELPVFEMFGNVFDPTNLTLLYCRFKLPVPVHVVNCMSLKKKSRNFFQLIENEIEYPVWNNPKKKIIFYPLSAVTDKYRIPDLVIFLCRAIKTDSKS